MAVFAGVMLAFILWKIDPKLDAITQSQDSLRAEIREQRAEEAAEARDLLNVMGQILMSSERTAYLQLVSCQQGARTPNELRECAKGY